jgi:hypothetical protein
MLTPPRWIVSQPKTMLESMDLDFCVSFAATPVCLLRCNHSGRSRHTSVHVVPSRK